MGRTKGTPEDTDFITMARMAGAHGFMAVNPDERKLLLRLRQTTWHGRDMVYEFAKVAQRLNPWDDNDEARSTYQFKAR